MFFFLLCFGRHLAILGTHDVFAESWKWPYILVILTSLHLLSAPACSLWSWSFDLSIHFLQRISSTELTLLFLSAKASTTPPLDRIWREEAGLPKPFLITMLSPSSSPREEILNLLVSFRTFFAYQSSNSSLHYTLIICSLDCFLVSIAKKKVG